MAALFHLGALMRVLLSSTRGQGHIRPLLPFAKGLQARGHEVRLASPEDARPVAEKAGLELMPFARLSDEEIKEQWVGRQGLKGEELMSFAIGEMFAGRTSERAMPMLEESILTWEPDLILRESLEFASFVMAEKHGIPHARVAVHNNAVEGEIVGHAADAMDRHLSAQGKGAQNGSGLWSEPIYTSFPAGFDGDCKHAPENPPFRVNLNSGQQAVESDWRRKSEKPLVYITFGTVVGEASFVFDEVFDMALEAADALDAEVLMTTGPKVSAERFVRVPANVEVRSFVPQSSVLKHASAIMHHGGSGTLSGAFEFGVPMVVVPLFADQPWNADRVEAAGLGVAVRERTAENMAQALQAILDDQGAAARAKAVADEMAGLPSIEVALDRIEALA